MFDLLIQYVSNHSTYYYAEKMRFVLRCDGVSFPIIFCVSFLWFKETEFLFFLVE